MSKIKYPFQIFLESAQDIPVPYHFEAKIDFLSEEKAEVAIRFLGREDYTEQDLIAQGLNPKDEWNWNGKIPDTWLNRIQQTIQNFQTKEPKFPDAYSFIGLMDADKVEYFPSQLNQRIEEFSNELMQALFEIIGIEQGLFLGFQFRTPSNEFIRITGEVSFANLNFVYNISKSDEERILNWPEIKKLMNHLFQAEFDPEKANEELKQRNSFSVYIGDGLWYTAGKSWDKPRGIRDYFDKLEFMLNKYFVND